MPDAPEIDGHLSPEAAAFFDGVCEGLSTLGIAFTRNPRLVRGLDYYCHTAFEFTTEALGAQGAVLAGGRYDGLVETMGGPPTPGVGWAGGIERLAALVEETVGDVAAAPRPIAIVPLGPRAEAAALGLAQRLRREGFAVELTYRGSLSKRLKRADQANGRGGGHPGRRRDGARRGDDSRSRTAVSRVETPEAELGTHLRPLRARPMSAATGFEERLDRVLDRHRELSQALSAMPPPPPAELAQLSREYTQLSPIVDAITALRAAREEADELQAMAEDPESEPEMQELAEAENAELMAAMPAKEEALKLLLLPADEADERNAILRFAPARAATKPRSSAAICSVCTSATSRRRAGASS